MKKTEVAFRLSCQKLFDEHAEIYFWTFTFQQAMDSWRYGFAWQGFVRTLSCDVYGNTLMGLRVVEVHPGGHGLHYHALLNKRIWVGEVRRIGRRFGIGRVHVRLADRNAEDYLANYLIKDPDLPVGIRRWGTVGGFEAVRKNNLEINSRFHRAVKKRQEWRLRRRKAIELHLVCGGKWNEHLSEAYKGVKSNRMSYKEVATLYCENVWGKPREKALKPTNEPF